MPFVATDQTGIIVDRASRKANISPLRQGPLYGLYEVPKGFDGRPGDLYDGEILIKDQEARKAERLRAIEEQLVHTYTEMTACQALNLTDLQKEKESIVNTLTAQLESLSNP